MFFQWKSRMPQQRMNFKIGGLSEPVEGQVCDQVITKYLRSCLLYLISNLVLISFKLLAIPCTDYFLAGKLI